MSIQKQTGQTVIWCIFGTTTSPMPRREIYDATASGPGPPLVLNRWATDPATELRAVDGVISTDKVDMPCG
jgi:hypothetical protein